MVEAIPEKDPGEMLGNIKDHPFAFDGNFKMTSNLINTTTLPGNAVDKK